jgi:dTDP-4-dehydrorhamnose 3,5-epimerase
MPNIKDSWRAIRLKELSAENKESLMRSVVHFLGQDYNKAFFTASDGASFCSELAAKIYKQAGISILDESLGIDWCIPTEHANLSEKDTKHPLLKEFDSPFTF